MATVSNKRSEKRDREKHEWIVEWMKHVLDFHKREWENLRRKKKFTKVIFLSHMTAAAAWYWNFICIHLWN